MSNFRKSKKQIKRNRKNKLKKTKNIKVQLGGAAAAIHSNGVNLKIPRNNSVFVNTKIKAIIDKFYGKQENQHIIFIFKSKHQEIKKNIEEGKITFTVNKIPYKKKICSKLDILKELIKHDKKYPPVAKQFFPDNKVSILSGTKLDKIDNFFNIKQPAFFVNYNSFPSLFDYDENEAEDYRANLMNPKIYPESKDYLGLLSEFVSIELSEIIATQMRYTYKITYTDTTIGKTGIIYINTMTELAESILDELIKKIISNVLIYVYVFDKLKDEKLSLPIVKLYFTGKKKELPPKNNFETVKKYFQYTPARLGKLIIKEPSDTATLFTSNYINTALTDPKKDIVIFREEEILKVLLHECMHYFKLIDCNTNNPYSVDHDFAIRSNQHDLTETFIETLADVFNAIIISPMDSGAFKDNLALEMEFIFKQAGKILQYTGYTNWDEYFKPDNRKDDIKIWQTTNMHNYYIMRTLAFFNLENIFTMAFRYLLPVLVPVPVEKEKVIGQHECVEMKTLLTQSITPPESEYARIINYFISQPITDMGLRMTMLE